MAGHTWEKAPNDFVTWICSVCREVRIGIRPGYDKPLPGICRAVVPPVPTPKPTCGSCRFWSKRTDEAAEMGGGYCRRYPPFAPSGMRIWMRGTASADIAPSSEYLNDAWPNVHQSEWCGEFVRADDDTGND